MVFAGTWFVWIGFAAISEFEVGNWFLDWPETPEKP
tara:strand:+ start:1357 stop:1464 length:108 start_codon:yes stop_codon:yes gene_type:complete